MTSRVVLVGLGAIGMGYDLALDDDSAVLTHARAFSRHPAFELAAGVDPDPERCRLFTQRYDRPAYATVAEALELHPPQLIVIATPTYTHANVLREVVRFPELRAILCEKPLAHSPIDALEMRALCAANKIELVVNFMRRSDPGVREVTRRIERQMIETPVKGVAWYTRGFLHNGAHIVNMLELWLGPVRDFTLIDAGRRHAENDAEPDVRLEFGRGTVTLLAAREEDFSHHSVELVSPNGLLRYDRGGETITWRCAARDAVFPEYTLLAHDAECIPSDMMRAQWHVTHELSRLMRGELAKLCMGADAMRTLESMHRVMGQR